MEIKRYIIDTSNDIRFIDSDTIVIKTITGRFQMKGENISSAIKDIVNYFKSPITINEVILLLKTKYTRDTLQAMLDFLIDKNVLIDECSSKYLKNYNRDYLEKTRYYTIGGKGLQTIVEDLGSMNIGIIGHKQFVDCLLKELIDGGLFFNFNIGITDRVETFSTVNSNPMVNQVYYSNISDLPYLDTFVGQSDFVIVSSNYRDNYLFNQVNESCLKKNKKWLRIIIDGNYSEVGPLFIPGKTCCYSCLNIREVSNMIENEYVFNNLDKRPKIYGEQLDKQIGLYSIYHLNHLSSAVACSEIMKYFTELQCNLLSQVIRINSDDYEIQKENIFRYHKCPICSRGGEFR